MSDKSKKLINNQKYLLGKVQKITNKTAEIIIEDGQKIIWPIKFLPPEIIVDSEVKLILNTEKSEENEREKIAKAIINEILKNNSK